jgi:ketosteroid isomerase-like protein
MDPYEAHLAVANRFFDALLAGDAATLDDVFAPEAVFWQNFSLRDIPKAEFLPGFIGLAKLIPDIRFEDVRRMGTPDGFVEQHILCGTTPSGAALRAYGCFVVTVRDGRITRLNEYLDPQQLAVLREARAAQ